MASEKITALIEEVKALTVLELSELVKALEPRSRSSRPSARSPVWAWLRPRPPLRAPPRP